MFVILLIASLGFFSAPEPLRGQEVRVNQRKIERERERKRKKDREAYEKAVKRHKDIQTRETKASMKRTKKAAARLTPVKR